MHPRHGALIGMLILALAGCGASATGLAPGSTAQAKGVGTGKGTVVLAGGGLEDDNRALWEAFYAAAKEASGRARPRIAVIGSGRASLKVASEAYYQDDDHLSYQHLFAKYGFDPVFVPIAIDNYRTANADPTNVALVQGADAVWFGGGSQAYHSRSLLKDDGSDTPLMAAVRAVYRRGGVIGGSSAGAAVMDANTYGEGTSYGYFVANRLVHKPLSAMHDGEDASLEPEGPGGGYTTGLGMVGDLNAGVDTHVNARGRYGRILVAMGTLHYRFGIALSENTALFIRGKRGVVRGADRVVIADGTNARYGSGGLFQVQGMQLSSLRQDDGFDFATGTATSSKGGIPAGFSAPRFDASNVFAEDEVPKALEALGTGPESTVSGCSQQTTPAAFRLNLTRSAKTLATVDAATRQISVLNVTADLAPASTR